MNALLIFLLLFFCEGCISQRVSVNSQSTVIEPLPIKFGGFKDSSIEFAVPLKVEQKKTGGYRSPVELRFKVLLTNWDVVRIPVEPTGATCGLRVRW